MNDIQDELFEQELRRIHPAALPTQLAVRLTHRPVQRVVAKPESRAVWLQELWLCLRWLSPVGAAAALAVFVTSRSTDRALETGLQASHVEIDRELVKTFEKVARTSDGTPIRLQFKEWKDLVTVRSAAGGVEMQRQTPRLEVVPARLEIF